MKLKDLLLEFDDKNLNKSLSANADKQASAANHTDGNDLKLTLTNALKKADAAYLALLTSVKINLHSTNVAQLDKVVFPKGVKVDKNKFAAIKELDIFNEVENAIATQLNNLFPNIKADVLFKNYMNNAINKYATKLSYSKGVEFFITKELAKYKVPEDKVKLTTSIIASLKGQLDDYYHGFLIIKHLKSLLGLLK